jgi:mRNA interferase MazF
MRKRSEPVKRGEVWWLHDPERKPRPVCILTRTEAVRVLHEVLVVPATTRPRGIHTEVPLDADDGMPRPCVLTLDNLRPAPKAWLLRQITTLSPARMHQVCEALRLATGC